MKKHKEIILVLDFGSQYSQLIARRVREQEVYCEIVRHDITADKVESISPKGLIFSRLKRNVLLFLTLKQNYLPLK